MSTRVPYNRGSNTGKEVQSAVDLVLKAVAEIARLDDRLTSAMSGDTWTALAAELGGGISDQQAQDTWTMIRNVRSSLEVGAIGELARLDQGSEL